MSIRNNLQDLNYEALREVLVAADILINYRKDKEPEKWKGDSNGCLGYPAAILLFSYIEAVGSIYMGKSKGDSFSVLRTSLFDNQLISKDLCSKMYEVYRNKITHNLLLPKNAYLNIEPNNPQAFVICTTEKNKEEIGSINLCALLAICKNSFEKLPEAFKAKFQGAEVVKFTEYRNQRQRNVPSVSTNPSGTSCEC